MEVCEANTSTTAAIPNSVLYLGLLGYNEYKNYVQFSFTSYVILCLFIIHSIAGHSPFLKIMFLSTQDTRIIV